MRSIETHFLSYKPVVTYYSFYFKGQPAVVNSAKDEEGAG